MPNRLEAVFGCTPESVRAARRFVAGTLTAWELDEVTEVAALCTSEVATNALHHARSAFRLAVESRAAEVVVEVRDDGPGDPVAAPADADAEGGRGMWLVAAMTERWGCERLAGGGKAVWFSLSTATLPPP